MCERIVYGHAHHVTGPHLSNLFLSGGTGKEFSLFLKTVDFIIPLVVFV